MQIPRIRLTRSHAVVRLQHQLEQQSYPRLQMGLIVALTGASGLLCSFVLLRVGVNSMALRYPLALLGAYASFLFLLWLWLRSQADDYRDLPDLTDLVSTRSCEHTAMPLRSGGGGDFGGAGASGSFDESGTAALAESEPLKAIGDAAGSSIDADEMTIPIFALVFTIGLAIASLYVVYIAPMLFAELLFDGALSYTLYRHLRAGDRSHWLTTAFRRTALPFGLTAVFLVVVGAAMAAYAPGARSIGEVMNTAGTQHPVKQAVSNP